MTFNDMFKHGMLIPTTAKQNPHLTFNPAFTINSNYTVELWGDKVIGFLYYRADHHDQFSLRANTEYDQVAFNNDQHFTVYEKIS